MIPVELKVRGVTVLKDVCVDFKAIPGNLIAITGKNGQGKTSLMESIYLSLYRMFPSRPAVYEFCVGRDAMVDFKFDWHNQPYEAVVNIDSVYSKMEAFLYDGQHNPLPGITGKTKDFDAVAEKLFGNASMILASSFASQNKRGSFIKLAKIDRKSLFIEMLNLALLQVVTEEFRKEYKKCSNELATKRAEASAIEDQMKRDIPDINQLKECLTAYEASYLNFDKEMTRLLELLGILKTKVANQKPIQDRILQETAKSTGFTDKLAVLKSRLKANNILLENQDKVATAAKEFEDKRAEQQQVRKILTQATVQRRELQLQKEEYDKQVNTLREQWLKHQGNKKLCDKSIADSQIAASTIDEVPCKAEGDFANCQFLIRAIEAKENLDKLNVDSLNIRQAMLKIQDDQKLIPKPNIEALTNYDAPIRELEGNISIIDERIKALENITADAGQIEQAKAKLEEIKEQIIAAEEGLRQAETAITAARAEGAMVTTAQRELTKVQLDLDTAKSSKSKLESDISRINREITQAESLKKTIEDNQKKLIPVKVAIADLEADQKDWNLLIEAFGPNGIQSLEIDAAGPTVSGIANDLLFSCFGPRFSIKFVTQMLKDDGVSYKDEFDIIVIDSEKGREGSIDGYSGGEQVVIAESVSLAIAIFNKMKSGIAWQTLFRDETTGPLDDENAPRYVQMLRRAREIGHFLKVYFIAHQDRLKDLADSRINIVNGTVEIL
jgi:exonuclease SbcC